MTKEDTYRERLQAFRAEAKARADKRQQELAELERNRKIKHVAELSGFLQSSGSCGLVVIGGSDVGAVKDGLVAKNGDKNVFFLTAPGALQGKGKDPGPTHLLLDLLQGFSARTGKEGLIVINGFDFRDQNKGGTPEIKEFIGGILNIGDKPQILAVGEGDIRDVDEKRRNKAGLAGQLVGRMALYNNVISFDPPTVYTNSSKFSYPAFGAGQSPQPTATVPEQLVIPSDHKRVGW